MKLLNKLIDKLKQLIEQKQQKCFWNPREEQLFLSFLSDSATACFWKGLLNRPEIAKHFIKQLCKLPQNKNLRVCRNLKEQKIMLSNYNQKFSITCSKSLLLALASDLEEEFYSAKTVEQAERNIIFDYTYIVGAGIINFELTSYKLSRSLSRYQGKKTKINNLIYNVTGHSHPYWQPRSIKLPGNEDKILRCSNDDIAYIYNTAIRHKIDYWIEIIIALIKKNKIAKKEFEKTNAIKLLKFELPRSYCYIRAQIIPIKDFDLYDYTEIIEQEPHKFFANISIEAI